MWQSGNSGVFWRLAASRESLEWQSVVNFGQSELSMGSGYLPLNPESLGGGPCICYLSTLHTACRKWGGYKRPCTDMGARHPRAWSQVGLRKHHYKQNYWRWWNSSWAISNAKTWCCESATLNMPANFENSAVAAWLEKVSFHSNPEETQWQRMPKLPHNCTHFTP